MAVLSGTAHGQLSNQPPTLIAGKAELLNTLKTSTLKAGDLFYLRTIGPWRQDGCTIPSHTTLTGHVESLSSSPTRPRDTTLAVRFSEVPCAESKSTLMTPLLISIKAPDPYATDRFNAGAPQTPVLSGIFPSEVRADGRPINIPTGNTAGASEALDRNDMDQLHDVRPHEKPMKTGEVRGYRGIALTLPGHEGPAARLSSEHNIVLVHQTEFAFAYAPTPSPSAEATTTSTPPPTPISTPTVNAAPLPPPPEEIEDVCASSGCKELAPIAETGEARALWSLPLAKLGYQPRPLQRVLGLDHSASVHFFGEDQILLTFTTHALVPRSSDKDAWASNPRAVRAVLISRADGHVLHVKDWTVSDDIGPFAWSLGNGVVLAHVGHDLVRFGPGLTIEQRFHLPGPLLFLSASPSGDLLLVATIHEKHTEKEHAQIASFLGPDIPIDEEYDLTGLTAAFQVTGTRRVTVPPLQPALFQDSTISAQPSHGTDWLLEQSTWAGESKRFAQFRSICPVQIQSLPRDLLFVQGCAPMEAHTSWYRVLNTHAATLFKGSNPNSDFLQQADSSDDGRLFAIASSHFNNRPVDRTSNLQVGDFTNLTVTVYDSATGKQLFAARPPHGSAQQDTFSLSPSNSSLAVLTSTSLQLFPLPAPAAKK